jgi:hypothetical protein
MRHKMEQPYADEPFDFGSHFQNPAVRYEKGSGMQIIAAELDRRIEKTTRLKAAREAQETLQAEVDAEALRNAPPPLKKARRSRAKPRD